MIVDMHTHTFPAHIAERTLAVLRDGIKSVSGTNVAPATDGTSRGLARVMTEAGVDLSVVMPIATRPEQTETINRVASTAYEDSGGRFVSFGSVHPADPQAPRTVARLAEAGFKGIKLHPEFQKEYIDSAAFSAIFRVAAEYRLVVTVHAGADIGLPPPVHATPEKIRRVIDAIPELTLVAAHLGGWNMWDDVCRYLVGTPVYMDTAFVSSFLGAPEARDLVTSHGVERVLFGSDCPWEHPAKTLDYIRSWGLDKHSEDLITGENARRILKI